MMNDPLLTKRRILTWKRKQNLVVTIYLQGYLSAEDEFRTSLPYQLNQEQGTLVDSNGTTIGEFVLVGAEVSVIWLSSPTVLLTLQRLGHLMFEQMQEAVL
jgi:hypothetical protein